MPRPVQADAERTRRTIVGVASPLFAQGGLRGVSMREVARGVGLSLGTVQYHFRTKDTLYAACLDDALAGLGRGVAPIGVLLDGLAREATAGATGPDAPEALVADLVRRGFVLARQQPEALRLIMRPVIETGALDPRWRTAGLAPYLEKSAHALARLTGRPSVRVRMDLQSLTALGMRYALSTADDLRRLGALPVETTDEEAVATFADHLADVARRLLFVSP